MKTLTVKPNEIPFKINSLRKYLRMGSNSDSLNSVLALAEGIYLRDLHLADPVIAYTILEIKAGDEENLNITFENNLVLNGNGIYRLLKDCHSAAIYFLSLGPALEKKIKELQAEDFYSAYILDGVASELVTGLQEIVLKELTDISAPAGIKLTKRFSPGYRGWDLSEQKKLFSLPGIEKTGIQLTEECYMLPAKSVSGIYGFY